MASIEQVPAKSKVYGVHQNKRLTSETYAAPIHKTRSETNGNPPLLPKVPQGTTQNENNASNPTDLAGAAAAEEESHPRSIQSLQNQSHGQNKPQNPQGNQHPTNDTESNGRNNISKAYVTAQQEIAAANSQIERLRVMLREKEIDSTRTKHENTLLKQVSNLIIVCFRMILVNFRAGMLTSIFDIRFH